MPVDGDETVSVIIIVTAGTRWLYQRVMAANTGHNDQLRQA